MERKPDSPANTVESTGEAAATTTPRLEPGTTPTLIGGPVPSTASAAQPSARYRLGDVLGRGGMGEVLTARDNQIGRAVAIKRMRGEPDEDAVTRFLREAKIQGRLDHPAIVPVHELCLDPEGRPYFVMKQLTGVTLSAVLASEDPAIWTKFNRQSLLRAFADVCLAIEFAHTRGVIHRDLKPANIMLGDFGEVYVLDWGIARVIGDAAERASVQDLDMPEAETVAGAMLGTPGYMSPEQIRGDVLDGRADVFALGCILYELLARRPLYPRGNEGIAVALNGLEAHPSQVADVPPELDEACARAAASEISKRTGSARELAEAVQRFLDGDRDLELRRTLARDELVRARAAADRGDSDRDRREAIRAAARALALDPHAQEPAELVGRLMLDPPKDTPPEVERELSDDAATLSRRHLKGAALATLGYFPLLANCYFAGVRETWFLASGVALAAAAFIMTTVASRQASPRLLFQLGILVHCGLIVVVTRGTSPVLIAPLIAIMVVIVSASETKLVALPWLIACATGAVVLPVVFEVTGLIGRTFEFKTNEVVLHPASSSVDPAVTLVGVCSGVVLVVSLAGWLIRNGVRERDRLLHRLQLQAWHLRQLMPQRSGGHQALTGAP